MRVLGNGLPDHGQPMVCRGQRPTWFMRRVSGRNEDHPIQSQGPLRLLGNGQVATVNRVKRAAQ